MFLHVAKLPDASIAASLLEVFQHRGVEFVGTQCCAVADHDQFSAGPRDRHVGAACVGQEPNFAAIVTPDHRQ